jgi:hypothetical protein
VGFARCQSYLLALTCHYGNRSGQLVGENQLRPAEENPGDDRRDQDQRTDQNRAEPRWTPPGPDYRGIGSGIGHETSVRRGECKNVHLLQTMGRVDVARTIELQIRHLKCA